MPAVTRRQERLVGRARSAQHDLDGTLVVDQRGQDPSIAIAERARSRADRDVDAEQPLVGSDRAQRAFCGEQSSRWSGDASTWTGSAEPPQTVHADQCQHADGEHRRMLEAEHAAAVDHGRQLTQITDP